jgi:hypothetical protein
MSPFHCVKGSQEAISKRLLKNTHLLRYPAASPSWWRGKKLLLIRRDATLRIPGALHLGIFDQPAKNDFFNRLYYNLNASNPHPSLQN